MPRCRVALRVLGIAVAAVLVYLAVSLLQVWLTSREYDPHPAAAIMVMGAAQYDGVPSPDLQARLDEALLLFRKGDSKLIVVTGGKEKGDRFTEAQAGARYLASMGVPAADILQAGGNNTYENVADALPQLRARHATTVLVTTDPFHEDRSMAISSSMGLRTVAHAHPDIAHQGLVDRAVLLEGGRRGRPGPYHRVRPPGLAP